METPIKILNMLLEDANENNKEIWILLQDLSKVYDRVDLTFLRKALHHIKVPNHAIDLLINLFTARKNAVFTAHGLSEYYDVKIGIDQGEVISPLLWCIYLDPLLCEVANLNKGYVIEYHWLSDLTTLTSKQLTAQVSSLAFMDDTNWIAGNQQDLESMLEIADEFYNFTHSALNKQKSKLLSTKQFLNPSVKLRFGSSYVDLCADQESVKFLGVWINSKRSPAFVKNQISLDIQRFINTLRYKPITDKQFVYIINMVLCPLIEYRIQLTPLSKLECEKFFAPICSLFKKKNKFAITLPNVLLNFHKFYNLNDLWSLQIKALSCALLHQFNNNSLYEHISTIHLFQLQTQFSLATSPLHSWNHTFNRYSHYNLIGASLSLIKSSSSHLSFTPSPKLVNRILGGQFPLSDIFPISLFSKYTNFLHQHNLIYLDQLIDATGQSLIAKPDLFLEILIIIRQV